jgi:hypothetical protein
VSGARVGIGNISERPFVLPDGEERVGITAILHFADDNRITAGAGSELVIGGERWRVVEVHSGDFRGSVSLEPAD